VKNVSVVLLGCLALLGCSKSMPLSPTASASNAIGAARGVVANSTTGRADPGRPGYEWAYVNGKTVLINAVEVPNSAPTRAQADFYEVVYPIGWENLNIGTPLCDPCDHEGNGIDFTDFHDHILDSMPGTGHSEFSPLWHVNLVIPAYNQQSAHDAQVTAAYATHIPTKSEAAVDVLLASKLPDGSPVAVEVDTHFYFLCAVVNSNAAR